MHDIGDALKDYPAILAVRIEGHTDSRGSHKSNQILSQNRAESVRAFLINYGIDASRMVAVGYGEEKPIASNDTSQGRKKNRRVEIHLVKVDQSQLNSVIRIDISSDLNE